MNSITTNPRADLAGATAPTIAPSLTQVLVVRIRARRNVSQAELKRLIRSLGRDMQAQGLAMAASNGWCVFTSTDDSRLSVSRHHVLNWLIDHEQFDKYMLVDPVSTEAVFGEDIELDDERDPLWRQPETKTLPLVRNLTRWTMWRQHQLKTTRLARTRKRGMQAKQRGAREHNGEGA